MFGFVSFTQNAAKGSAKGSAKDLGSTLAVYLTYWAEVYHYTRYTQFSLDNYLVL